MMNRSSCLRAWALTAGLALVVEMGLGPGLFSGVGQAQPPPSSPEGMRGQWRPPLTPQERRDRIRMLRTWRLIEVLELKDAQSEKFFLALKRNDAEEDKLIGERERLSRSLKGLLDRPEAPERVLLDTIQAIRHQDDLLREAKNRFRAEATSILSLRQQAKMLLFEQRFDSVLREAIMDVLTGRRERREGWGTPSPWGQPGELKKPGEGGEPSK